MHPKKVLLIDNYDSFTYIIFHYLEKLEVPTVVVKNDELMVEEVEQFDKIIISPGPGLPQQAGKTNEVIASYHRKKPILGICLGMQALAEFFGGKLYNQKHVKHGVQEDVFLLESALYTNLPAKIKVGLYHSWAIQIDNVNDLKPTAFSENNVLMSLEHTSLPIVGVQYHPESIMTEKGLEIIANFIKYY